MLSMLISLLRQQTIAMSQHDKNEVKKFYDDYIPHQTKIGINLRHRYILVF